MTIDRDQLRAEALTDIAHDGTSAWAGISATTLLALLDQLDQAEARIKAVRDVVDADEHVTKHMGTLGQCRPDVPAIAHDTIRRALEG